MTVVVPMKLCLSDPTIQGFYKYIHMHVAAYIIYLKC